MIDNTKFNAQLAEFSVEIAHFGKRVTATHSAGMTRGQKATYEYTVSECTELIKWLSHWMTHPGTLRSPGSFLLFYSALVLKNDEYSRAGQPEHKIAGNREFAKYTARLMETLVSCVS